MKKKPQHLKPRPMDLRRHAQQQIIAHLLLMGWGVGRIAKRLHCTERAVRYWMDREEFQKLFDEMQQDHFKTVHRKLGSLLNGAVDALEGMLRNKDWRCRNAALEHVFRIHGRYIDRVDVSGTLDHSGRIHHVPAELLSDSPMTDQMREKARELLSLQREAIQRQLPAKFGGSRYDEHDVTNGRFVPQSDGESAR